MRPSCALHPQIASSAPMLRGDMHCKGQGIGAHAYMKTEADGEEEGQDGLSSEIGAFGSEATWVSKETLFRCPGWVPRCENQQIDSPLCSSYDRLSPTTKSNNAFANVSVCAFTQHILICSSDRQ